MRSLVGFRCIASLGVLLLAGCGDGGNSAEIGCAEGVCPCNEGGIRAAISEGLGPYTFDCEGPTSVMTSREIVIENDVTLDGEGNLTVDANRRHRVFSVLDGVTAELIGVTVANGNETAENGGGIRNEGTLTLMNSTVSGNSAGDDTGCRTDDPALLCSEGGGIWNAGTLTLMDSTVSGNSAPFGGGISNREGSLTLVDSTVLGNSAEGCRGVGAVLCSGGGGIWNSGTLTMLDSNVSGNTANWGAGIYNRGVPTLSNTIVSGNSAGFDGGGLLNFETLALTDSTVTDNVAGQSGGGIANEAGTLEVRNSTLSGNTAASAGGGMFNPAGAAAELVNATVSANTADTWGGGIYTGGELLLASCTIARNDAPTASAIYDPGSPSGGLRSIMNTLIEGDCAGPGSPFDSNGYNIESPGNTCGFDQVGDQVGDQANVPPDQLNLGPLRDNDGLTETHALQTVPVVSVAIDRIPEAACDVDVDQRGETRPETGGTMCDVGAFEVQP